MKKIIIIILIIIFVLVAGCESSVGSASNQTINAFCNNWPKNTWNPCSTLLSLNNQINITNSSAEELVAKFESLFNITISK